MLFFEVGPGEFLDRWSILAIKAERLKDPAHLEFVFRELYRLQTTWAASEFGSRDVSDWSASLRVVNEALWEIEDRIRLKEAAGRFDDDFIELARSVYRTNDRRGALKRQIDEALGAGLSEPKLYASY